MPTIIRIMFAPLPMIIALAFPNVSDAGYLDFSTNWNAVNDIPMSKRKAENLASQCKRVQAFSNGPKSNGAVIVAGPHRFGADQNTHITVRLYQSNSLVGACHVYVTTKLLYKSCSCE